jgi:hypothetical protein
MARRKVGAAGGISSRCAASSIQNEAVFLLVDTPSVASHAVVQLGADSNSLPVVARGRAREQPWMERAGAMTRGVASCQVPASTRRTNAYKDSQCAALIEELGNYDSNAWDPPSPRKNSHSTPLDMTLSA